MVFRKWGSLMSQGTKFLYTGRKKSSLLAGQCPYMYNIYPKKRKGKGVKGEKTPVCVSVGDGREGEKRQRREKQHLSSLSHISEKRGGGTSSSRRPIFTYFLIFFTCPYSTSPILSPAPSLRPSSPARLRRRRSGLFSARQRGNGAT